MSGFKRAGPSKVPYIEGTKPSIKSSQLILSTGCGALDSLLGGGLPVGLILLIEEDEFDAYSPILTKYFLAEGVMNKHDLFLASASDDPSEFLEDLPAPIAKDDPADYQLPASGSDKMKIAFRYENLPKFNSGLEQKTSGIGVNSHSYDLGAKMPIETISSNSSVRKTFSPVSENSLHVPPTQQLLAELSQLLNTSSPYSSSSDVKKNILRLAIRGLGSPLWGDQNLIPGFLWKLKALLRQSFAACIVSVPGNILRSEVLTRIRRNTDAGFRLESFFGLDKETNPLFADYHGLLHILHLPRVNMIQAHIPDCFDLAFKLRRKKFYIEKLHLPPDLSETSEDSNSGSIPSLGGGCASNLSKSKLDF